MSRRYVPCQPVCQGCRCFAFFFVAVLLAGAAEAQVNIEKLRGADAKGLGIWIEMDAGIRTGSVDRQDIGGELRLDHVHPDRRVLLIADGELGWQDGRRYSNAGLLHLRQTRALGRRLGWEVFAQFDYARQRRLDGRALGGLGLRLGLLPGGGLYWGSAWMLEREVNDVPAGARHPRRTTHQRWSNYLSGSLPVSSRARLEVTAYAQPRFAAPGDLRLLGESRLGVDVGGPVRLDVSLSLRYDSEPVDGIDGLDARMRTSLAVRL